MYSKFWHWFRTSEQILTLIDYLVLYSPSWQFQNSQQKTQSQNYRTWNLIFINDKKKLSNTLKLMKWNNTKSKHLSTTWKKILSSTSSDMNFYFSKSHVCSPIIFSYFLQITWKPLIESMLGFHVQKNLLRNLSTFSEIKFYRNWKNWTWKTFQKTWKTF